MNITRYLPSAARILGTAGKCPRSLGMKSCLTGLLTGKMFGASAVCRTPLRGLGRHYSTTGELQKAQPFKVHIYQKATEDDEHPIFETTFDSEQYESTEKCKQVVLDHLRDWKFPSPREEMQLIHAFFSDLQTNWLEFQCEFDDRIFGVKLLGNRNAMLTDKEDIPTQVVATGEKVFRRTCTVWGNWNKTFSSESATRDGDPTLIAFFNSKSLAEVKECSTNLGIVQIYTRAPVDAGIEDENEK